MIEFKTEYDKDNGPKYHKVGVGIYEDGTLKSNIAWVKNKKWAKRIEKALNNLPEEEKDI